MTKEPVKRPDWPRMMLRSTAAAYLDMSIAEFERGVFSGLIPMPTRFVNRDRWCRVEIDRRLESLAAAGLPDWRPASNFYKNRGWRDQQPLYQDEKASRGNSNGRLKKDD